MQKPFTASKHSDKNGRPISIDIREPVLDGIFFFDEEDRRENPILEDSIAELASKIWMRSYLKFEEELNKIITYFNTRCAELAIEPKTFDLYQSHLNQLFDMESLDKHQFLILKKIDKQELGQLSHEFKLRLQFGDLNTYIVSRNLVYLTFMSMLQYSRSIEQEYIYLLIILTFLVLYYIESNFTYFKYSTDTIDYSAYEIARILSKERKAKFDALVSDSVKNYDKAQVHITFGKLLQILFDETLEDSVLLEERIDSVLSELVSLRSSEKIAYDHRRKTQSMMIALDMDKTKHISIQEKQETLGLIDSILSSKTIPDKYKSDFKISSLTSQTLIILIEGNSCRNEWLSEHITKHKLLYHIHNLDKNKIVNRCSITIELSTMAFFSLIPQMQKDDVRASMRLTNYKNSVSNLINQTDPGVNRSQISPKLGISRPRNKPQLVINSEKNIFVHNPNVGIELQKPAGIMSLPNYRDQPVSEPLDEIELLRIMESLLQTGIISAYEFDIFEEDESIIFLFLSLDFDQQERLFSKKIDKESRDQIRNVMQSPNISISLLIDR